MTRDPATEKMYSRPPTGARCTLISNKHELMAVVITSLTHVMDVCEVRW